MTKDDRWRRVEEICQAALDRQLPDRPSFVAIACGDDEQLQRDVETLLAQTEDADRFLEDPLDAVAASVVGDPAAAMLGRRVGRYAIESWLGAGGMGDVYRARDTELARDVALKTLPESMLADRDRRDRFEREARTLATLNHPNIGAIYGIERLDGRRVLVLELVEGDTLADRIAALGAGLPIDDAMSIGRQIAGALEAAHEKGIVHRDLKPANIKITPDGSVKVLDFGLAKASTPSSSDLVQSPPLAGTPTLEGTLLGSCGYMSPEQVRGQQVDKRTDIWGFGCVLYEILTGRAAFPGDTLPDYIAALLEREPDWAALPHSTPAGVLKLIQRCLERDPRRRLHDIGDARIEIEDIERSGDLRSMDVIHAASTRSARRWLAGVLTVSAAFGLGVAATITSRSTPTASVEALRFTLAQPEAQHLPDFTGMLSMSPDGRQIAFVSGELHSAWKLNVRSIGSLETRTLAGTEGAFSPFWSPDSRFIGFVTATRKLKTIDPGGGPPVTLTDDADESPAWSSQGVILFERWRHGLVVAPGTEDGRLFRIAATGGQPAPATELDASRGEVQHTRPAFLPDGHRFIFTALSSDPAQSAVYLASLDSRARTRLVDFASQAQYASGYLLYQRDGTLIAQRFDEKNARLVGDAVRLVDNLNTGPTGAASFSASQTGALVYREGTDARTLLTWFDAHGNVIGTAGDVGEHQYPRLSPDARRVVFAQRDEAKGYTLWQLDVARNVASPFTFHPDPDFHTVVWSPDSARVVFASSRVNPGVFDFYQRAVDGGSEELLYASPQSKIPSAFSPDGTVLLFGEDAGAGRDYDIFALPMSGDRKPFPVVRTPFREFAAVFSPDGHWIAYQSNDSGTEQVLVQPFPPTGSPVRLSNTTGYAPQWLATGDIVYATADQRLMAVAVTTTRGVLRAGTPRELFAHRYSGGRGNAFNVDRGGRRFLLPVPQEQAGNRPISVIVNWPSLLMHK